MKELVLSLLALLGMMIITALAYAIAASLVVVVVVSVVKWLFL